MKYIASALFLALVAALSLVVSAKPLTPPEPRPKETSEAEKRVESTAIPGQIRIVRCPIPLLSGTCLINYEPVCQACGFDPPQRATLPNPPFRPVAEPPVWSLPPDELVPATLSLKACPTSDEVRDWGHTNLNLSEAQKATKGRGVKIAILDTGCDMNHPDLKDRVIASKDFTNSRSGASDVQGHGTHCAGIALASENGTGVIGAAPEASLIVAKVLGDNGSGSVDGIAKGIEWAIEQGADVISMSLGGPGADSWIPPALAKAEAAGVLVIAAAGNEGPGANTCGYPGLYQPCIAIAATDSSNAVASFSSRCSAVFAACPGVSILAPYPGGRYARLSGTSMATPYKAGTAGLWIASHPAIAKKDRPKAYRAALQAACKDLAPAGRDTATGFGLPDATKLVAGGSTQPPPVDPPPTPMPGAEVIRFTAADLKTFDGIRRLVNLATSDKTLGVEVTVPKP